MKDQLVIMAKQLGALTAFVERNPILANITSCVVAGVSEYSRPMVAFYRPSKTAVMLSLGSGGWERIQSSDRKYWHLEKMTCGVLVQVRDAEDRKSTVQETKDAMADRLTAGMMN